MRKLMVAPAWLVLLAAGCSGGAGKVYGLVTLDGEPVPEAQVTFYAGQGHPKPGSMYATTTNAQGRYQMPANIPVVAGDYKVSVVKYITTDSVNVPAGIDIMQLKLMGKAKNSLPSKYENEKMSPLTANVKSGDNDIPIQLLKK